MLFFLFCFFFFLERHCSDVNKDKTLNMRQQKHILSQFLVSVTLTLTLNTYFMTYRHIF